MAGAAGMFGAPVGVSQAEADIKAQQLNELAMGEGKVRLEQAQLTLASQKQMLELLRQATTEGGQQGPQGPMNLVSGPQTDKLADTMDLMATIAIRSGNPVQAREYATAGSTIRHQAAESQKLHMEQTISELNMIGSLMDGVHDEASWRQANAMYQQQTGKPTPYANLPYNPRVVEELRNGVMNAKDRALTAAAKARENASIATEKERTARIPLIRAQTALATERTTALRKAGAVTKIPKPSDLKAITDLMTKEFGGALMPEEMRVLARPVAENMLEIMKSQNISQSEAAEKAYQNARNTGAFGGIRPRVHMGGTAERPLDLPASKDKLKPNMYYKGKAGGPYEGKTLLWTGAAFVPVGKGPGMIQPDSGDDEEEGDQDSGDETDEEGIARGDYEEAR